MTKKLHPLPLRPYRSSTPHAVCLNSPQLLLTVLPTPTFPLNTYVTATETNFTVTANGSVRN